MVSKQITRFQIPKAPLALILLAGVILLGLIFISQPVKTVSAQCKNLTGCKNCHEVQAADPVNTNGAWHVDHANFDLCYACHAGNREATDKAEAHTGMVTKLQDMPSSCKQCHANDLEQRFNTYAQSLNLNDPSVLKAAQSSSDAMQGLASFLGQQPAEVGGPTAVPTEIAGKAVEAVVKPVNSLGNAILAGLLLLGVFGGGGYITWNERRLAQAKGTRPRSWIAVQLQKEHWSPYSAGVLLGITCILAVLIAHRTLGASSAFASIGSTAVNVAAPQAADQNMYFKFIMPPGFNWEIALLIGVFFGGMLGALSSGTFKLRWNDDPTWKKVFGPQRWKRFVIGFIGAIILQIGAGIAGGCTSGLAISGGMLLAPSAFLFMAGMFISGIGVALLIYRRKY